LTLLLEAGAGGPTALAAARREDPAPLADDVEEEEELVLAPPPELLEPAEEGLDRPDEAAGGGAVLAPPPGAAGAGAFVGAEEEDLLAVAAGGGLDPDDDEAPLLADDDPFTEDVLEAPPGGPDLGPVVALAPSMTGPLRSFMRALVDFSLGFFVMSDSTAFRPGRAFTAGGRTAGGAGGGGGGILDSHVKMRNDADWLIIVLCNLLQFNTLPASPTILYYCNCSVTILILNKCFNNNNNQQ